MLRLAREIVAVARPRRKEQEQAGTVLARDGVPLARGERRERADAPLDDLVAAANLRLPLDDNEPRALADLVVVHGLAGLEAKSDRPRTVVGREHLRVDRPAGRLELREVPGLHGRKPTAPGLVARRRDVRTLAVVPPAVDSLTLGPLSTNCYVVRADRTAEEAVVVDPSGAASEIGLALASLGARCVAILVTHGHFDHVLGLADLAKGTGAVVHAPAGERALLEHPDRYAPPGLPLRPWTPDVLLEGGERLELAGVRFDVIAVPGHSPAHLAYATEENLFSGDVLFAGSVGRTDLPGGDWPTLLESIRRLRDALPPDTAVHPGHGPSTTLAAELAGNPFLADLRAESHEIAR